MSVKLRIREEEAAVSTEAHRVMFCPGADGHGTARPDGNGRPNDSCSHVSVSLWIISGDLADLVVLLRMYCNKAMVVVPVH